MKSTFQGVAISFFALIVCLGIAIPAQSNADSKASSARWVGVWQGKLEGVPGVVLTLGDDLGDLSGTIVFTAMRDGAVAAHITHVITHPHIDGESFSFQVKRPGRESNLVDMTLTLSSDSKGLLTCATCGSAASTEMEKIP